MRPLTTVGQHVRFQIKGLKESHLTHRTLVGAFTSVCRHVPPQPRRTGESLAACRITMVAEGTQRRRSVISMQNQCFMTATFVLSPCDRSATLNLKFRPKIGLGEKVRRPKIFFCCWRHSGRFFLKNSPPAEMKNVHPCYSVEASCQIWLLLVFFS